MRTGEVPSQQGAPVRCLVVDDEEPILTLVARCLERQPGVAVSTAGDGLEALEMLADHESFDLVLTDLRMPGADGMRVLRHVRSLSDDIPVIVMSSVAAVEDMVRMQEAGATLFLRKPFGIPQLQMLLGQAIRLAKQLRIARTVDTIAPRKEVRLPGLVGRSPAFVRALVHLASLARTEAPLLIEGETGTGKELVARAGQALSRRADGPFVAINCSALTDSLLDSELFGHLRGAFTGAMRDHPGLFREAHGGTIFLDEIGDMSPAGQAKILRVLQEGEVRPVGATTPVRVDVRVMAATHRDLSAMVDEGRFRQDLFYRLRVGLVRLPPLRERYEDVVPMANLFLERFKKDSGITAQGFEPEATAALLAHPWPGNVRELEATVTRAAAVSTGGVITAADLELPVPNGQTGDAFSNDAVSSGANPAISEDLRPYADAKHNILESFERSYLARLMARFPTPTLAATRAGMDRKSLYRLLRKYGVTHAGEEGEPAAGPPTE